MLPQRKQTKQCREKAVKYDFYDQGQSYYYSNFSAV